MPVETVAGVGGLFKNVRLFPCCTEICQFPGAGQLGLPPKYQVPPFWAKLGLGPERVHGGLLWQGASP